MNPSRTSSVLFSRLIIRGQDRVRRSVLPYSLQEKRHDCHKCYSRDNSCLQRLARSEGPEEAIKVLKGIG